MGPGEQALLQVCKKGDAAFAKQLLQTGVDLEVRDKHGKTPLLRAAKYGHVEVIKVLLANKANLSATTKDKRNALHMAGTAGYEDAIGCLLNFGALNLLDQADETGKKPLECVPWKKRPKVAEVIQIAQEEASRAAPLMMPQKQDPRMAQQQGYINAYAQGAPPFPPPPGMGYGPPPGMPRGGPQGGPGPMFNGWNQRAPGRAGPPPPGYGGPAAADTWRCLSQSRVPGPPRQMPMQHGFNMVAGPMGGDMGGGDVWKTLSTPVAVKPDKRSANWQAAANQLQTGLDLAKEVIARGATVRVNGRKCKLFCSKIEQLGTALKQLMLLIQTRSAPDEAVPATKRGMTTVMEMLEAVQILMIEWAACNGCDFGALFMALQREVFDQEFQTILKKITDSYNAMNASLSQSGINLASVDTLQREYEMADDDDRASMLTTILAITSEIGGAKGYSLSKLVEKHSLSMSTLLQLVKKHDIGPQEILDLLMGQNDSGSAAAAAMKQHAAEAKCKNVEGKDEDADKLDSMKC